MTREEYVNRVVGYVLPKDPELAKEVLECRTLKGLYLGKSMRISRLLQIAYSRGVRAGASMAWSAAQPVTTRSLGEENKGGE